MICSFLVCLSTTSFSQEEEIIYSGYPVVEASYSGGVTEMRKFIQENMEIPNGFHGTGKVYLRFTINELGEVGEIEIAKGIDECPACSDVAIAVFKKMPKWKPAYSFSDKKNVSSRFRLPIKFER